MNFTNSVNISFLKEQKTFPGFAPIRIMLTKNIHKLDLPFPTSNNSPSLRLHKRQSTS